MHTPHIPPDFTDEASYRAYLKAEANGQVRISAHGASPSIMNGQPVTRSEFTDEASYLAYLKACAAGLVSTNGKIEDSAQAKAMLAAHMGHAHVPPDFTDEASYRAYLKAEANGQIKIFGKPTAPTAQAGKAIGLAAMSANPPAPRMCAGRNGEWVKCPDFPDVEVFRPSA